VIINDVTRIREMEVYIEKVKGVYLASVAHELRTPLNSIIPMSETLKTRLQGSQEARQAEVIYSSAKYLQNVIEDALDMTRMENNTFEVHEEAFDPRECLKMVKDCLQVQMDNKGLVFECQCSEEVPSSVQSDKKRYSQILFNLLGNALKFTFEGGVRVDVFYR